MVARSARRDRGPVDGPRGLFDRGTCDPTQLAGTRWSVDSVDGVRVVGDPPILAFDPVADTVVLSAACGSVEGAYGLDPDRAAIFFDLPTSPVADCEATRAARDRPLLEALTGPTG